MFHIYIIMIIALISIISFTKQFISIKIEMSVAKKLDFCVKKVRKFRSIVRDIRYHVWCKFVKVFIFNLLVMLICSTCFFIHARDILSTIQYFAFNQKHINNINCIKITKIHLFNFRVSTFVQFYCYQNKLKQSCWQDFFDKKTRQTRFNLLLLRAI